MMTRAVADASVTSSTGRGGPLAEVAYSHERRRRIGLATEGPAQGLDMATGSAGGTTARASPSRQAVASTPVGLLPVKDLCAPSRFRSSMDVQTVGIDYVC